MGYWGHVWLDFDRPFPNKRTLSRTTPICRVTYSYYSDFYPWTKILKFLYCVCETVIKMSGEGHLETDGWGMGGVIRIQKSSMRIGCGLEEFKFVTYTETGQEFLSQFCPTNPSENGSRLKAWSVRSCWFCWKPCPQCKWPCWPFMTCAKPLTAAWPSPMWSC